jgi:outer membrane protein OmpA-like peptidoglycan-associated protein/osmotically-inducible protein OsmY
MPNWLRWIRPGLVATLLLAVVAVVARSGMVERDIAGRVNARLASDGLSWAAAEASGRNVTLHGVAPSTESQEAAMRSALAVAGVRGVSDRSDLLALATPYIWTAKKDGRAVTLTGSIPSEAFRNSLLAAARRALPDAAIRDEMSLARGAPTGFSAGTAFALQRLTSLETGMVTLTDGVLAVSGTAVASADYIAVRTALANAVPPGVTLGPVEIAAARADPFVWSANFDGKATTLSGYVPNEVVHETLVAAARATLPGMPVIDKLAIASGEPLGFAEAASFSLTALTRFSQGGVTLDGLKLDISGTARTVDDYDALLGEFAGALPKGVRIVSSAIAPATVSPYGWKGERQDGVVTLTGYMPSPDQKAEVLKSARGLFGDGKVVDHVRIAAGEPRMDWIGAVKFALDQLANLGRGTVVVGDKVYAIEGEAATPEAFAAIIDANGKTLPASLELKGASVTPPKISPYRLVAEREGNSVVIEGHAASVADRDAILAVARQKFAGLDLVDRLAYAGGAPDGYVAAASAAIQAASRLAAGRAEIVDQAVSISGGAYQPAAAGEIDEAVRDSLPDGFAAKITIDTLQPGQPVTPERCRDLLENELQSGRIEFDGGKADLASDSLGLLDRVAAVLDRCPDTPVEIGAHTDSDGSTSKNRDLSQARADAVLEYLVGAGIRRERLTAVGYGESKPIADNSTAAGRAQNRRIEFVVVLPPPPTASDTPAATDIPAAPSGGGAKPAGGG